MNNVATQEQLKNIENIKENVKKLILELLKEKYKRELKELEKKTAPIGGYGNKSLIPTFYKYVLDGYKLNNKLSNILGKIKRNAQQIKGKDSRAINRSLNDRRCL